jgi:hypothetical protein
LFADCRPEIEALARNSNGKSTGEIIRELVSEAIVARRLKRLGRTVRSVSTLPTDAGELSPDLEPTDSLLSGLHERFDRIESATASAIESATASAAERGRQILDRLDDEAARLEAVSRFGAQSAGQSAALLWLLVRTHPQFAGKTDAEFEDSRRDVERRILEQLDSAIEGDLDSDPR